MTGVTVILCEKGGMAGIDISGGGPASRETPLLSPLTADNPQSYICKIDTPSKNQLNMDAIASATIAAGTSAAKKARRTNDGFSDLFFFSE